MRIDVSVDMPYPLKDVFVAYRDHLPELVPYLHNVRAITVQSRTEEGGRVKLLNRWKGGGEIPSVVRKFISQELLEWDDHAEWDEAAMICHWRTVVPAFKDAVDARGRNLFTAKGPSVTSYTIEGELTVDAAKVKGVPRLLAGTVSPAVEAFLVAAIKPNLVSVAKGVEKFLAAKR